MSQVFWSLMAIPKVPNPPRRVWRDWVLVALFCVAAVVEVVVRDDLGWRPFAAVAGILPIFALPWRRTYPLAVVAIGFALHISGDLALLFGADSAVLFSSIWVLLLPYALLRWGSGREAFFGIIVIALTHAHAFEGWLLALVGIEILLLPAQIGAAVRFVANTRQRELDQTKNREREQLARELHDTVAHHVSAIAIQAQAGRAVAATNPEAAVNALVTIEEEASRTLIEMRTMVAALRQGEDADLTPQRGVQDIRRLTETVPSQPAVNLALSGSLDDLRPSVDSAVYRIAQESITNALRHANQPTQIEVSVAGDNDQVQVVVRDDGGFTPLSASPVSGFGLDGMMERAKLLGGTLTAGPNGGKGWTVTAVLPKHALSKHELSKHELSKHELSKHAARS